MKIILALVIHARLRSKAPDVRFAVCCAVFENSNTCCISSSNLGKDRANQREFECVKSTIRVNQDPLASATGGSLRVSIEKNCNMKEDDNMKRNELPRSKLRGITSASSGYADVKESRF